MVFIVISGIFAILSSSLMMALNRPAGEVLLTIFHGGMLVYIAFCIDHNRRKNIELENMLKDTETNESL